MRRAKIKLRKLYKIGQFQHENEFSAEIHCITGNKTELNFILLPVINKQHKPTK